ncbi:MAG: hypothetical protein KA791_04560 [Flavobacteriales bacterium]|nr:hypothetical protein [Flavobacteriales bacterium]
MNGKHPIDDLFARGLRDAEATPPPGVWEGIVRERGKAHPPSADSAATTRNRSRWGLAAILLLLLSAAGYWIVSQQDTNGADGHASVQPSPGGEGPATRSMPPVTESGSSTPDQSAVETPSNTSATTVQEPEATSSSAGPTADPVVKQADASDRSPTRVVKERASEKPAGQRSSRSKQPGTKSPTWTTAAGKDMREAAVTDDGRTSNSPANENTSPPSLNEKTKIDPSSETSAVSKDMGADPADPGSSASTAQGSSGTVGRTTPDVHLSMLTGLVTPFMNHTAAQPGPILRGDSTPTYVLKKGNWWFGVQAGVSTLTGEWRGTGPEVSELNKSETWRAGQSLALVVGRDWLSGWSSGISAGITRHRSQFLHHESEPGHVETVVDTTWTSAPMGTQTNYTWDIVETVVEEPGVERDYNATNTYTSLRIAPEVGYRLLGRHRFSLHARGGLALSMDLGRKGSTLVSTTTTSDSLEVVSASITRLDLSDASLDDRFPISFSVFASAELRYRLCEHWSLGVLPMFTWNLPRSEENTPRASFTEVGGALRLRYDLGHKERRVK